LALERGRNKSTVRREGLNGGQRPDPASRLKRSPPHSIPPSGKSDPIPPNPQYERRIRPSRPSTTHSDGLPSSWSLKMSPMNAIHAKRSEVAAILAATFPHYRGRKFEGDLNQRGIVDLRIREAADALWTTIKQLQVIRKIRSPRGVFHRWIRLDSRLLR